MNGRTIEKVLERVPLFSETGPKLSRRLHSLVLRGGEPTRRLADFLHGTWLGHPLHPVLTDLTVGAWTLGSCFDAIAAVKGSREAERMADTLTTIGTVSAVPTLLSGLTDYTTVQKPALPAATLHGATNAVNLLLYIASIDQRRRGNRKTGITLSLSAMALATFSAWLGGHLVYAQKVGVDHSQSKGPDGWHAVLDSDQLPEMTPQRIDVDGNPVLLIRCDGEVHAMGAVCSHAGGPLEEGTFKDCYVQCPWHDSVFDLRDGSIVHGPAIQPQPLFETRVRAGKIEVRIVET